MSEQPSKERTLLTVEYEPRTNNMTRDPWSVKRFAPVAPPELLRDLKHNHPEAFGDYHLVLAHDIIARPEQYDGLFSRECTVIIDNSVIEEGVSVDVATIAMASRIIGGCTQVLVLPEVLKDPIATMKLSTTSLKALLAYQEAGRLGTQESKLTYMLVLQGTELCDVKYMMQNYQQDGLLQNYIGALGIPRYMVPPIGSRLPVVLLTRYMLSKYPYFAQKAKVKLHLLGFSDLIADDILCCREPDVAGIDSAVPLRLGQRGEGLILDFVGDQAGPRGNYWQTEHKATSHTVSNIKRIQGTINGAWACNYTPNLKVDLA